MGQADNPTWLEIDSKGVKFHSALSMWGRDTAETANSIKDYGSGPLVIGQAGENMVSYANIVSGTRFFGRTGLGAVMGSKNIKALVAKGGEYKIVAAKPMII